MNMGYTQGIDDQQNEMKNAAILTFLGEEMLVQQGG